MIILRWIRDLRYRFRPKKHDHWYFAPRECEPETEYTWLDFLNSLKDERGGEFVL